MENFKKIDVFERYNKYGKLYYYILLWYGIKKIKVKEFRAWYNFEKYIVFGYNGTHIFELNIVGGDMLMTRLCDKSSFEYLIPVNKDYNPEDVNSPLYKLEL